MGNESNFTGINWENVNGTAELIKNNANSVVRCIYTDLTEKFLKPLSGAWSSENAVNWWKTISVQLEGDINTVINIYDSLLNKISHAVKVWCSKTGTSNSFDRANSGYDIGVYFNTNNFLIGPFQTIGTSIFGLNDTVIFTTHDILGRTGMDIKVVRDELLPIMTYTLNNAIEVVDSMPTSIGLYDNAGEQLAGFNEEVNNIRNIVLQLAENLKTSIEEYLQTEINNTLLAKQETTNTLNS